MSDILEGGASVDSGSAAVLGHTILGAVATVAGAVATLRENGTAIPPEDRALLEAAIGRNLATITDAARILMAGEPVETA